MGPFIMFLSCYLFSLVLQVSLSARSIVEFRTKTGTENGAGCDCAMEVAMVTPQGICVTNELGNDHIDDFEGGHLDSFTGAQLGECLDFEPGDSNSSTPVPMPGSGSTLRL